MKAVLISLLQLDRRLKYLENLLSHMTGNCLSRKEIRGQTDKYLLIFILSSKIYVLKTKWLRISQFD